MSEAVGAADIARRDPYSLMFDKQREALADIGNDGRRAIALLCSRRAGKTRGFLLRAIKEMQANPGCRIPYIALTRKSAEGILWSSIDEVNKELGLGLVPRKADLAWVAPSGATLFLVGANKADEIEKLRGQKFPLVGIDEAGSFRATLLNMLVEDVLEASLMDYDGTLILVGTPTAACVGYFHDVTTGRSKGWDVYRWTVLDNPFIKHAKEWLRRLRERKGWDEDNPTYRREYLGEWVKDESALVYKLLRSRNVRREMPEGYSPDSRAWTHILGIDYGYVDACAWVVLAFRRNRASGDQGVYVVESLKRNTLSVGEHMELLEYLTARGIPGEVDRPEGAGLLPEEAAWLTRRLVDKYNPVRVVGDAGGLGKSYIEQARRRWRLAIEPADKTAKLAQIELVNDGLRTSRVHVIEEANRDLLAEAEILQWDMEKVEVSTGGLIRHELRRVIDSRFEDHLCDALQYAYGAAWAYANEAPAKKPLLQQDPDVLDAEKDRRGRKSHRQEAGWLASRKKKKAAANWWKG